MSKVGEENKEEKEVEQNLELPEGKGSFFSRIKNKYKTRRQKKIKQLEAEELSEEESKKVEEKIVEATKEVSKSSGKKKKIMNVLFFILNLVLVAGILLWNIFSGSGDFEPLNLKVMDLKYIALSLLFVGLIVLSDTLSVHRMVYRKTFRSRWCLSYKSVSLLRYYDAVTPMAAGGQAFMVTYLTGRGVPGSTSLAIPIAKLLFQNISWLIITFVCLVISFAKGMGSLVSVASVIGFILCFLLVAIILFMSFFKKSAQKVVDWGLKLLVKMHIIKNYDKHYTKVMRFVEDYQSIMKEYGKSKLDVVFLILTHSARVILLFSIPYFIYKSFPYNGGEIGTYADLFVYTALIDLASSFIPLPGGTGMNEITFTALFSKYLRGSTFWALLFWRFCSYYFYLLQGLGVLTYDTLYGNRKYRWVKKRYELQGESQQFRRMQIENFRTERNKRRKKISKENKS